MDDRFRRLGRLDNLLLFRSVTRFDRILSVVLLMLSSYRLRIRGTLEVLRVSSLLLLTLLTLLLIVLSVLRLGSVGIVVVVVVVLLVIVIHHVVILSSVVVILSLRSRNALTSINILELLIVVDREGVHVVEGHVKFREHHLLNWEWGNHHSSWVESDELVVVVVVVKEGTEHLKVRIGVLIGILSLSFVLFILILQFLFVDLLGSQVVSIFVAFE